MALNLLTNKKQTTMKKVIYSALLLGAFAMGTSSCTKTCDAGYEGSDCKTEVRTKYFGTYNVSGTAVNAGGSSNISNLIVTVGTRTGDVQDFSFSFVLGGDTYLFQGTLDANGTAFTVPSQTVQTLQYSGNGSFTTSSMQVQLSEVDGGTTTTINLSGAKI